jgi:hypothetical protein
MNVRKFNWKVARAVFFSTLWVAVVFIVTFPSFLKEGGCFLTKTFTYQDTGWFLLMSIGVFVLDFIIHISYSDHSVDNLKKVIRGIAACSLISSFIVPISTTMGLNNWMIWIVFCAMWIVKGYILLLVDEENYNYLSTNIELVDICSDKYLL